MADYITIPLMLGAMAVTYVLPAIIAAMRRHQNTPAIAALNILLGWTELGWIAAFVWACTYVPPVPPPSKWIDMRRGF